jgi:hypothetical protein
MQNDDDPPDWELELRVFHACGDQTPPPLRELLKDLWKAYCDMEVRAENAEKLVAGNVE